MHNLLLTHLSETRRRSILLWSALPTEKMNWKPDETAMTAGELIRHVLEADYGWNMIIRHEDMSNYSAPWKGKPILDLQTELDFAEPYRKAFLSTIRGLSTEDLEAVSVHHPGRAKPKHMAEYILRTAYHEAVHAGQFQSYLRQLNVERPFIWD
ncbi:DinB family protein [Phaeocystidibacter marisrubri]|uniref:DinB family protein n=1 Tax=Phaeocystidibacter marisrubri TaxID=1577780 RepID=A0A6L3ZK32_9FLAO|nr:DinB family protein [Phaeocystidibacter marisrubri]KAB2817500.1 DinB family protein [Phaeocystidibacter marisrubri]GGH75035.1 hypothetical protein GCM10011318_21650 [Phaeocystidibacter marisrubri]